MPVNICPIVPLIFKKANIAFKLVDIEKVTLCINQKKTLLHAKDKNCIGLLYAYTYGIQYPIDSFFNTLKKINNNFIIIEDKCLCVPSFKIEDTSEYADITIYSTGYAKFLDLGYGGFGICNDNIKYSVHRTNFINKHFQNTTNGYKKALASNIKFNNLHQNWLDNREFNLHEIDYKKDVCKGIIEMTHHKSKINQVYRNNLSNSIIINPNHENKPSWRFNIRVSKKEELLKEIFKNKLFASSLYRRIDGVFTETIISAPIAELLQKEVVNLFNDKYYTDDMAKKTCEIINNHISKYN